MNQKDTREQQAKDIFKKLESYQKKDIVRVKDILWGPADVRIRLINPEKKIVIPRCLLTSDNASQLISIKEDDVEEGLLGVDIHNVTFVFHKKSCSFLWDNNQIQLLYKLPTPPENH